MSNPEERGGKQESLFLSHKDKVYPWVKAVWNEDEKEDTNVVVELTNEEEPIYRKWLGDLAIFHVVDRSDNFQLLQARDLPDDVSKEQLHRVAIENLRRDIVEYVTENQKKN